MPLWLVIMGLGAGFCGWCFLKARELDSKQKLKKVRQGHKSVKKAAKHLASIPSGIVEEYPEVSEGPVTFSLDTPSAVAEELTEILRGTQ